MVLDKSSVKIRLETQAGEQLPVADITASTNSALSFGTSAKLKSLDQAGTGELNLQDLIDTLDLQLKQKQQLKFQRLVIIAGVLLLLCSFGLSLGSSVLSFAMMNQLEVHDRTFTDREGRTLGSQPRNPSVSNVTRDDESTSRRLSDDSAISLKVPVDDFKQFIANYEIGATTFVVPVGNVKYTAEVLDADDTHAHGRAGSGDEWWAQCEADQPHCSVTVQHALQARALSAEGGERQLLSRALFMKAEDLGMEEGRLCGKEEYNGEFNLACNGCATIKEMVPIEECGAVDDAVQEALKECQSGTCFNSCCYADSYNAEQAKTDWWRRENERRQR